MRIAADARILELPRPTGVERALAELLRGLGRVLGDGEEVVAYVRRRPEAGWLAGIPGIRPIGGPRAIAVWRETSLVRALEDDGADVLWSPVAAIPLRTSVPRVATFHEAPWLVRPGMEGVLRERVHRIRVGIAARRAARIVCPSEASAAQFRALHPSAAVRVVPHGVSPRFRNEARAPDERQPLLLHVGGNRPRKDVGLLLDAFGRYRRAGGRAELVMVGPGDPPPDLPEGATFRGYVEDEELLALYAGALALAVSSESEGFGLPLLEAMAAGVPVVTTSAGALGEVAAGAALVVEPGDAQGLADALLAVENDPALRADLTRRGHDRVASASWDRSAERLLDVLREAAALR